MFTIIEDAKAVTKCKGIYRQVKMYERQSRIYVSWSNGYISVNKASSKLATSIPDVTIDEMVLPIEHKYTSTGYLVIKEFKEVVQTAHEANQAMFGERANTKNVKLTHIKG